MQYQAQDVHAFTNIHARPSPAAGPCAARSWWRDGGWRCCLWGLCVHADVSGLVACVHADVSGFVACVRAMYM